METTTGFDLNLEIGRWRDGFRQSPAFHAANLDELEDHLRDSVADLQRRGLSAAEALLIAARRTGGAGDLEPEFAKVNRAAVWLHRGLGMLVGVQVWGLLGGISRTAADAVVIGGLAGAGYQPEPFQGAVSSWLLPGTLLSIAQMLALGLSLAFAWWLVRRGEARLAATASRTLQRPLFAVLAAGAVSVVFLALQAAGYAENVQLARWLSPSGFGALAASKSVSAAVLFAAQTVMLAALTVWLARRRLGRARSG